VQQDISYTNKTVSNAHQIVMFVQIKLPARHVHHSLPLFLGHARPVHQTAQFVQPQLPVQHALQIPLRFLFQEHVSYAHQTA